MREGLSRPGEKFVTEGASDVETAPVYPSLPLLLFPDRG